VRSVARLAILYPLEVQRTQGIPIQIRVGLNSGRRRWGWLQSEMRTEYTTS
jgi:hypothetical protein